MDLIAVLREDYARFPRSQHYDIYSETVFFRDPLNEFRGRDRYQQMIQWIERWFQNIHMDLHEIKGTQQQIRTQWTLSWSLSWLPWHPRLRVDGWTEIEVDEQGLISSHIDYWKCSRLDLLKQLFLRSESSHRDRGSGAL